MNKKLELSRDEWMSITSRKSWIDNYDNGDVIKVYHPNGSVFRYKIVSRKIAEPI